MKYATLNNGVVMPMIGYGTYQTPARITEKCVLEAIRSGYRSIDTAQCYGNEKEVGIACRKSGITREELFITTKLWGCSGYQDTLHSIESSLKNLDLDYIDLLLIHEPAGDVYEIYRAMETFYKNGKLRAIGVSNFLEERYLDLVNHCKIIPAINQVETVMTLNKTQMTNASAIQNLLKNVSGAIGTSLVSTLVTRYSQVHQHMSVGNLTSLNPNYTNRLNHLISAFSGYSQDAAQKMAEGYLYKELVTQSTLFGYIDAFRVFGIVCFFIIPLLFLFRKQSKT